MRVTLSCDHRACSGADGAKLLQTVKRYLQAPVAAARLTADRQVQWSPMQLTDVMSTQIVSVAPATPDRRCRTADDRGRHRRRDGAGAGDDLVGVITERDLLRCVSEGIDPDTPVSERMTRHVLTAAPATELAEAMALMVDGHFRHLPVVNEDGHVVGMVSMRDLMAYTSLRLRHGCAGTEDDDLDPAEVIATIHRMRTGAA